MNKRLYRTCFEIRHTIDGKTGKPRRIARYIGPYYRLTGTAEKRKRQLIRLLICLSALLAGFLVCGLINTDSSRCAYVAPPYLLQIVPLIFLIIGLYRLTRLGSKWTVIDKAETVDSLQHSAWGVTLLAGLALIGQIVFFFVEKQLASLTGDIVFTLGLAVSTAAGAQLIRLTAAIAYEKCEEGEMAAGKKRSAQ